MVVTAKRFAAAALSEGRERRFFETIQLANGTFKTTNFRRLDDLNRLVADTWKQMGASPRAILDVAVSSGVSTNEWVEQLVDEGFDVSVTATDLTLVSHLVTLAPGLRVLLDRSGHVLQYSLFGIALPKRRPWFEYLSGAALIKKVADRIMRSKRSDAFLEGSRQEVMLANHAALKHPRIKFVEDDLFAPSPTSFVGRFDAIRAANILNLAYFAEDDMKPALANLRARLSGVGAFLIVVRTRSDGSNHGTMFRLDKNDKLDPVVRIGDGSEIEDIILSAA